MTVRRAAVGDVQIAYRTGGRDDAPPLVLLHALGQDATTWDDVTPILGSAFRVVAVDLRGHGASDRPGSYSFELMRDDVVGLLDALGLDRVTLVGHSMGGTVAYLVAEEHPGRVERLVLEDTPPPFPSTTTVRDRPDGPLPFDWDVIPAIVAQLDQPDPAWWDRLIEVTATTLVVAGGPESPIPQGALADVVARVPRCRMVTIPAGHHVHAARPQEFAAAILGFAQVALP